MIKLSNEQIDDLIDIWHKSVTIDSELWHFLGWSKSDYTKCVLDPSFVPNSEMNQDTLDLLLLLKG